MSLYLCSDGDALRLLLRDHAWQLTWLTGESGAGVAPDLGRSLEIVAWNGQALDGADGALVIALDPAALPDQSRRALHDAVQQRLAAAVPVIIAAEALALAGGIVPFTHVARAPLPHNLGPALLHQLGVRRLLVLCGTVTACFDAPTATLSVQGSGSVFAATLPSTAQLATIPLSVHVLGGGMRLPW